MQINKPFVIRVFEGKSIGLQAYVLMNPIHSRHVIFDTIDISKKQFDAQSIVEHLRKLADQIESELKK